VFGFLGAFSETTLKLKILRVVAEICFGILPLSFKKKGKTKTNGWRRGQSFAKHTYTTTHAV
jgi:hypothetical protein